MAEFQTSIQDIDDLTIIHLNGYIDAHTYPMLEEAFTNQVERSRYKLVVDFTNIKYINSAGLGVFMAFIETMRGNAGDIKLAAMQPNVFNIFDLLGFPLLYEIFPTVEEAIQKFTNNNEAAS
ncbi:MAG: STAS domain-containing protein [Ignavibacteria bacterium]|nr:STAS domain-containing protein [Ignavibacteria bacterium]